MKRLIVAAALLCVGWLIYFIHHISHAVSVNHIVDRIMRETEFVIGELMPFWRHPMQMEEVLHALPEKLAFVIVSRQSG
jgi:uncharacterized membrane protein